ncbi:major facilitator superfamily domain-containing protein [Aspergillus aurantiobrunneus]
MRDIVRSSAFGQCLRFFTGSKAARYPEENPHFQPPIGYLDSYQDIDSGLSPGADQEPASHIVVVGWYGKDDPESPYNWSFGKKLWVAMLLFAYTFSVYIGSSLYTAGTHAIVESYGVSNTVASLGLSVYVFAYGLGPMLFSPLSEIPAIGRTLPYITTYIVFVILCVPMSLVDSIAGILVLRFLLGFFGSPCLATAGASYGDFYGSNAMPYVIALWGGGATLGPALGPLVAGFAVQENGWRWSPWELLWLSGPIMVLMFFSMPETSPDTILHRRAQRLRIRTGRKELKSLSEIRQSKMNPREITFNAIIKPWEINALDPAQGLAFLSVLWGLCVAVTLLCAYFYGVAPQQLGKLDAIPQAARIWPGLFATWLIPTGLSIFAWTANPDIHWIAGLLGIAISMCGVFIITQCMFIYLPFTYPRFAGSLFAANGFARSLFAGASILFARPMFDGIGISGGVTLLASLSVLCIAGVFVLYFLGGRLRERSRFARA